MSVKRSSGGGQSSLGYLFGSGELGQKGDDLAKISSPPATTPAYGSGRGQSSLGYLFGSGEQGNDQVKVWSTPVCMPPYGTDDVDEKSPEKTPAPPITKDEGFSPTKYIYHKVDGVNSKDFLMTGRPSTKVTSVPGGDSSLGYLFGDK